jgi:hypothetical protein
MAFYKMVKSGYELFNVLKMMKMSLLKRSTLGAGEFRAMSSQVGHDIISCKLFFYKVAD